MTLFWLLGAALAVAAAAWVLRPLLAARGSGPLSRDAANVAVYRDQMRELEADLAAGTLAREDYERARSELEARLLQDVGQAAAKSSRSGGRAAAWGVGAAIPLVAAALYFMVGNPGAIDREATLQATAAQIESMIERLAAHLRENPDDVAGWKLLARSYGAMGRYAQAADAYARAAAREPRDAQLIADLADMLAMARGQSLQGEPEQLVLRALELEPANLKALALAGTAAFERGDYAGAAALWERMLPQVDKDSEEARSIQQNVSEARARAAQSKVPEKAHAGVQGTVSLSPKLKDQAAPDDTVFVFARAVDGPPLPLAVARVRVRDLPYRFRLDDSMAMSPATKLSAFPNVVVSARVSKSGTPTAQPGDLQGASAPVANDASAVSVVIDSLVR